METDSPQISAAAKPKPTDVTKVNWNAIRVRRVLTRILREARVTELIVPHSPCPPHHLLLVHSEKVFRGGYCVKCGAVVIVNPVTGQREVVVPGPTGEGYPPAGPSTERIGEQSPEAKARLDLEADHEDGDVDRHSRDARRDEGDGDGDERDRDEHVRVDGGNAGAPKPA